MIQNMPIVVAMLCCIVKILFILSLIDKQYFVCLMTPRKFENSKSAPFFQHYHCILYILPSLFYPSHSLFLLQEYNYNKIIQHALGEELNYF